MYRKIIEEFSKFPRDIHTVPLKSNKSLWFHVFVKDNTIHIEPSHNKTPSSKAKPRKLSETDAQKYQKSTTDEQKENPYQKKPKIVHIPKFIGTAFSQK